MNTTFYASDLDSPITFDIDPVSIAPAPGYSPLPRAAAAPEERGYQQPYANPQRNSRVPAALPGPVWDLRWQADLSGAFLPMFILQEGGHLIVQQERAWQLFDDRGTARARGARGEGNLFIDRANDLFYLNNPMGFLTAHDLARGEEQFAIAVSFGEGYHRTVLSRSGRQMLMVSIELPEMSPSELHDPEYTILEVQDLGAFPEVDEDGVLSTAHRLARLMARPVPLLTALLGETLVLAAPDHVFLANQALQVTTDLTGTFTPLAMSLDEAGRIYLIVLLQDETEAEYHALWILTPRGERLAAVEIPAHSAGVYTPPIVGYDHRVYVLLGDRVLALSPGGQLLWNRPAGTTISGAVVTADDQLLVAAGGMLLAFDAEGERRALFYLEDDQWTTPPVLTERQHLLIASERHLYCLQAKQ